MDPERTGPPSAATRAPLDFDAVFAEHAQRVARWAARLLGPGSDAEDVTQDVFVIVDRKLASFRGDAALSTWLYRITENVVRSHRRKRRLKRLVYAGLGRDYAVDQPSAYPTPVEVLERREDATRLYRALDRLSERDRTVLIMFELEGLSGAEIGHLFDIEVGAVWVRLHRARRRFAIQVAKLQTGPNEERI